MTVAHALTDAAIGGGVALFVLVANELRSRYLRKKDRR